MVAGFFFPPLSPFNLNKQIEKNSLNIHLSQVCPEVQWKMVKISNNI